MRERQERVRESSSETTCPSSLRSARRLISSHAGSSASVGFLCTLIFPFLFYFLLLLALFAGAHTLIAL